MALSTSNETGLKRAIEDCDDVEFTEGINNTCGHLSGSCKESLQVKLRERYSPLPLRRTDRQGSIFLT